jgi:hypothetical protein
MKVSNKVTLLGAAVAALFATAAQAQVTLSSTVPAVAAVSGKTYASEIANGVALTGALQINTVLGIGTSINQDRYIKFTLTNASFTSAVTASTIAGLAFTTAAPNVTVPASITPTVSLGGNAGNNVVIFQITTPAGANVSDGISFTIPAAGINVTGTSSNATVTYEVYEFLAQATGSVTPAVAPLYIRTGTIATFTPTVAFRNTATPVPTQVATALSSYLNFNSGTAGSAATAANTAVVGNLDLTTVAAPGFIADGVTPATFTLVTAATGSTVTVAGDFAAAAAAANVTFGTAAATTLTSSSAVFGVSNTGLPVTRAVSYNVNGTTAIPASSYVANYAGVGATGYRAVAIGPITTGSITRDGVQFESPWVTATPGFISRFFLTQTSPGMVPYTVIVRNAAGLVTGGTLTGTLAGGRQTLITLASLLPADTTAFPGPYQVTFNIAADASQTQGSYVLTTPTSSVSSVPLYRASNR